MLTILGSTGSVGTSTLDVVALHPDRFKVHTLTANNNVAKIVEQCQRFEPQKVVMQRESAAQQVSTKLAELGLAIEVLAGAEAVNTMRFFNAYLMIKINQALRVFI